ncbi:xanthine dehydrogenase family protein molybdopterin-binding subunit [Tindallia californiensis]|uniref:Aldehyde oxidase and xanthine dehydrogenase, a/b hammerhead domain n=1 Tax=Tindallia californiensis TaxID=159292 RepID=A0A1H3Q700_9FIRM|nr:molybdopterin cofactor-binding domain-containing protein [Tindallia californiensis]SDZ09294.1 Aldehyde oxidase and xanthine dehydrogenase, a/b hammerhead domain [Tindallia californiensis]
MTWHSVGKSEIRVDGKSKVTGAALYSEDFQMEGMAFGRTLRSDRPHAYFQLETEKAKRMPGVLKIFTAADVPHNAHGVLLKDHEVFCEKKVRRIGDPLAFLVATTEKEAEAALKAIKVTYQDLPAVFDPEEALQPEAPLIHEKGNLVYHFKLRKGNSETGFSQSHAIVEETYRTPMVDHAFLQPEAGIAYPENQRIVVCAANQYPHFDQLEIAEALQLPAESVKVINPAVGGAFGGREDVTMQIHLALAAQRLQRPVKTVYSRQESFYAHSKRHAMIMRLKTGADEKGHLKALEATIYSDTGAYASWAINVLRKAGVHATGPYVIPHVKIDGYSAYTNNPFAGAMRGFGAAQIPIAHEGQMDALAEKLGISPIEIRLKNAFRPGDHTATGQRLKESVPFVECLQAVSSAMNWEESKQEVAK